MDFKALSSNNWPPLLSDTGRKVELPQGIFHWAGRAKAEADINGTIGTAEGKESDFLPGGGDKVVTYHLPSVREKIALLNQEQIFAYAPILGTPAFRKAWRSWILKKCAPHYPINPDLLGTSMAVPGVSTGLSYVARLFLSPGEAMVCPDKRWENYDLMFTGCMDMPIASYAFFSNGKPAFENLEAKLVEVAKTQDKLVTVLNFPNNPTGYMPTKEEALSLRDAMVRVVEATGKRLILILDDAYDGYVFEENAAQISIFGLFAGLHPNIIPVKIDGVSKEFLWYGGRVAAITFGFHPDVKDRQGLEKEIENKIGALVRGSVSNSPRLVQEAVSLALDDMDRVQSERQVIQNVLAARCHALKDALKNIDPAVAAADPFNAGFFCLLNVKTADAETLADHLLKKYRVGTIPITDKAFGINALRIAFCSVDISQIGEMIDRIGKGIAGLS